ncbi:hypothetical protein [Neorhodopirellula pilleata]|nr:hypothetical protein [Neorhodopirellula pilleata]
MAIDNPYQTPINPYTPTSNSAFIGPQGQIYRKGRILIMHRDATLPDICFKSNEPTAGYRLRRKLSWHNQWIALAILLNVLIYLLIAIIVSKRATVMIPLSDHWRVLRRKRIRNAWVLCLGGPILFVAGIMMMGQGPDAELAGSFCLMAGGLILLFGLFYAIFRTRLVTPVMIDEHFVHLKGAHPEFLNRFEAYSF